MELMKYNDGAVLVRKMPGDGHCLFSAICNQLYKTKVGTREHYKKVIELRKSIVRYIRENIEEFKTSILMTLNLLDGAGSDVNMQIGLFLQRLESTNEWGGEESIAAASRLLNRRIDVFLEDGPVLSFNEPGTAFGVIRLAYRSAGRVSRNAARNHYDVVVQRLMEPPTSQDSSDSRFQPPPSWITRAQRNARINASQIPNHEDINSTGVSISSRQRYDEDTNFRFLTWNARGCSDEAKRIAMDLLFTQEQYSLIAVQETRLAQCTSETPNYYWYNVNVENPKDRVGGGTAIMVAKQIFEAHRFKKISDNSCSYLCKVFDHKIVFISSYIRSELNRENVEFDRLLEFLTHLPEDLKDNVIIAGDLNAWIGKRDLTEDDKKCIGRSLHHDLCNINGSCLKELMHAANLKDYLTFSTSESIKITWTNGRSTSQLDHIVMSKMGFLKCPIIRGYYKINMHSDHKMIECTLRPAIATTSRKRHQSQAGAVPAAKRYKFNLEPLKKFEEKREKFQTAINQNLASKAVNENASIEEKWSRIKTTVLEAAMSTLSTQRSPLTPRRKQACKDYWDANQRHLANRNDPNLKKRATEARKLKQKAFEEHFSEKVDNLLAEINNQNAMAQMTAVFRFIKQHKRKKESKSRKYINIQKWEQKLQEQAPINQRQQSHTIEEDDGRDAGTEPTIEEVRSIIWTARNNCAPGLDQIHNEFWKYGSEELLTELTSLLREVFNGNIIPRNWTETVQIPIPKKQAPQNVDDYRRITLCQTVYKIYARLLLNRLRQQIQPVPAYQMGFQAKRSASDQIFVLRRILDERWRKGCYTILVSLDLKQAFDRLDITKSAAILSDLGVSKALINRIIVACLHETTSVQWFGQRTNSTHKGRGVKQGCPLSPELFVLLLHHALTSVNEFLPDITLKQGSSIKLPCILGYADDLLFLCRDREDVERLLTILEPILASIGLEINTLKTKVLIRDPFYVNNEEPETTSIFGKYKLTVASKLRYLGAYITSSLTRNETTAERRKKAYKAFYYLCSFLKEHKLKWPVVIKLYHSLITPIVTYSMEVATLLKRNRNSLRRMENHMLRTLKQLSLHDKQDEQQSNEQISQRDEIFPEEDPENVVVSESETESEDQHIAPKWLKGRTINNKIRINRLNYYGHILRSDNKGILKTALEYKLPIKKKIGRPAFTWRTSIRQDIDRSGINITDWQAAYSERDRYKNMTKKLYDTMVESEYEEESDIDEDSTGSSLILSDLEGFSENDQTQWDLNSDQEADSHQA